MSINVSIVYNTIISRILLWLSDIAVILIIGVTTVVGHNARLEYYTEPLTSSPGSLGPATNGRTVRGETDQWEAGRCKGWHPSSLSAPSAADTDSGEATCSGVQPGPALLQSLVCRD